jgi:hypothetical protein
MAIVDDWPRFLYTHSSFHSLYFFPCIKIMSWDVDVASHYIICNDRLVHTTEILYKNKKISFLFFSFESWLFALPCVISLRPHIPPTSRRICGWTERLWSHLHVPFHAHHFHEVRKPHQIKSKIISYLIISITFVFICLCVMDTVHK